MADWNPESYLKFKKERTRPSIDLAERIEVENPQKILDIGCGPGNSTAVLKRRFPNAAIIGIDNSPNMIEAAAKTYPDIEFKLIDASCELDRLGEDTFDVVFSNACIQWLPNHSELLTEMMKLLKKSGVMAVQIPVNYDEPVHKIISSISESDEWHEKLSGVRSIETLSEEEYFDILSLISSDFSMWKTVYFHRMPTYESIIEWYRATGLKPYLSQLDYNEQRVLETQIIEELKRQYPIRQNGEIIFRFPRLFFTAIK